MGVCKLWFIILLLPAYNNSQVTDVKTTGRESYVAPICTNEIMNTVLVVVCKISTDKSSGAECRLAYRYGQELFNGCDSRFTLMKKNQTFFLQLTNLTSVDSGSYSCECTKREGTNTLHLNITVEDEEVNSSILPISTSLAVGISCGVTAFIVITGVVLGFILRKIHCRNCSRTDTSALPARETPRSLDKDDPDNLYANLVQIQPETVIQVIKFMKTFEPREENINIGKIFHLPLYIYRHHTAKKHTTSCVDSLLRHNHTCLMATCIEQQPRDFCENHWDRAICYSNMQK
ncbi:uncharacterized protein LOC121891967 [Scomber scombrus]|uniref:Uncharacterized protein LOC121891967 n=1 Tax=Scomber scombrus TaxID=13677 RepID=A0AAV1Q1R2_SCOSC